MAEVFKAAVVQAAPVFMDLDGCVEKAISLIAEASANDAHNIAFPEYWIPVYPWWFWPSYGHYADLSTRCRPDRYESPANDHRFPSG